MAIERDTAEREAREKETRVLSLTRELDDLMVKVEELERGKRTLQNELDELINNQGTADKNVSGVLFYVVIKLVFKKCNSFYIINSYRYMNWKKRRGCWSLS